MSHTATMPRFDNPIQVLHHLRDAGFTERQAESWVEIFSDYVEHNLATKKDLKELELTTKRDLKELELKLTLKTAAIVGSIVGFFSLMEKFF